MRGITMDQSLSIILNTFKKAEEMEAYALAAIVLDAGGRVKAFLKQDGASLMRFEIARGKAFGALALNRSSRMVLQKSREKPPFMDTLRDLADGPIFLEAGGQLIRDEFGEVIGAIGVTGDVNEVDDICAIAGIRAAGLKSDEDFSEAEAKRLNIKSGPKLVDPRQR
ncbi:heme-binding protein [Methylocella sp. CPCC 101449]|uniref:GlcG/HbpS family heme-binding protein n=1 Tax=Methylocella sp. CPCC 101449 TaxID=2987531 RepID=UPI00289207B5|nr:heme-binding protein [Methylocella sp. CPCC 101449]MDT2021464.1 heme-binding protein [Methylocella sp. CPCC 101449]